ncbi:Histone-lysine N-methyltransferase 2E [Entomophthora muscae]|uniref:Histone-lysine N-methyltransferase 2E n=1 Tax=Entomophthora muscae TaxID=34485 RepID=A0ACC2TQL6_9FUNG|nr:Histone-lysine N-methyltransferase 2E [Entomophthora muscae]
MGRSQQEDDGIVRCACNGKEEHESFIRCDKCFVWQHIVCMGVKEKNLHKKYYCEICSPSSHTVERGTSRRRFEIKIEEVERIKAPETKRSRSLILSLSANKSSPKNPRKYNHSNSKKTSFSRQVIVTDSDESSCSSSPTPDFTTKRGRKTNQLSYKKYSADPYYEEQENRESTNLSSKEVSPSRPLKSSSD